MSHGSMVPVLVLILLACLPVGLPAWTVLRARSHVEAWARREGLTLRSASLRLVRRGPYWLAASKAQHVFRLRATDSNGSTRPPARASSGSGGTFAA